MHNAHNKDAPCYLEGEVELDRADPRLPVALAIAVNGQVRAVTRTYSLPGLLITWSAIVPESALNEGDNKVELFVIDKSESGVSLRPCYP